MPNTANDTIRPLKIASREGVFDGHTDGRVAAFDKPSTDGALPLRKFVLLERYIQLVHSPPWLRPGSWYADLVDIQWQGPDRLELTDLCLDLVIAGDGRSYHIEDFDDLADALDGQTYSLAALSRAFRGLEAFLQQELHAGAFPPQALKPFWPDAAWPAS